MRPTVVALREFYASALGRQVRHALTLSLKSIWPDLASDHLLGIGYANPLLRPYLRQEKSEEATIFSLMPAAQGAVVWPDYGANRTVLYAPPQLPLRDQQCNRLLLLHALEHSEDAPKLMAECWRLLVPGGRMVVIVPHRRSIWSRAQSTPFAAGTPYSAAQLRDVVCEHFTHIQTRSALAFFPSQSLWLLRLSRFMERLAPWILPMLGGVMVMEVEKQIYAGIKQRSKERGLGAYVPVPAKPALSLDKKGASLANR